MRVVSLLSGCAVVLGWAMVGCSATTEPEAASDGQALSTAECQTKADDERDKAEATCQRANTYDHEACMKPSNDRVAAASAALAAAYGKVKGEVDALTGQCKAEADGRSCEVLLREAGEWAAATGRSHADTAKAVCQELREQAKNRCDIGVFAGLTEVLGADRTYVDAVDERQSAGRAWVGGIVSCGFQRASMAASRPLCATRASIAATSTYFACRRECPAITGSACTPQGYAEKNLDVPCGTLANVKTNLRLTCESGATCARTAVCDAFDDAQSKALDLNAAARCALPDGTQGVNVPRVVVKKSANGSFDVPGSVEVSCQPLR